MSMEEYEDVEQSILHDEDTIRDSEEDYPIKKLSGDEATEQSFAANSMYSSRWAQGKKSSYGMTIISIVKSLIGVGILGFANVAKNFGGLLFIFLIIGFGLLVQVLNQLLVKCKNLSLHSNYSTIGYHIYSHRAIISIINVVIIMNNIGLSMAELLVFGTTTRNVIELFYQGTAWYASKSFVMLIGGILLFPTSLIEKIEKLKFVSLFGVMGITIFLFVVLYNFFSFISKGEVADGFSFFPQNFQFSSAFGALPTILLAFNWQFNFFPIFKGMSDSTDKKFLQATSIGLSISSTIYIISGLLPFICYGSAIKANLMETISREQLGDVLYFILNVAYMVITSLTMPIMFFGARNNFLALLKKNKTGEKNVNDINPDEVMQQKYKKKRAERLRFYIGTFCLWFFFVGLAIALGDIEIVFNLIGAISSNLIGCVFPTLFYIKLTEKNPKSKSRFYIFKFLLYMTFVFLVVCVTSEILKVVQE